ncbi:putative 6-phosphofructo-2-kinase/fructose-2,6-biphosphatase [Trypanosoma rangeli]|uniref:Putative 6-phosphofructo-2-kinase/fructose-2,6-biphosphatase n=1 Tax=Trypanosoma rangeli TaxID=5698 RepID=A0A422N2F4_TRYRA|nr:putative 6-phosphofructo-2-kinase/fructose-2,6-biphosphatase [Trypanosoma rangeli]RNE99623.1 putative 6-phosphofructo-2-kinase/fructose-2,6-biphosphatase [Trypanosoma rangeli]|eukprot:RNE99623.1 putative 6-phosphofructo-2-kinase/fructose-2,6-biphosphatase [Trypanosoma rangeli]
MSVGVKVNAGASGWAMNLSLEPSDSSTTLSGDNATSVTTAAEARRSLLSADERGARLLELVGGPVRPFSSWHWREAKFFTDLREAQEAKESPTTPYPPMGAEIGSAQALAAHDAPQIHSPSARNFNCTASGLSCEELNDALSAFLQPDPLSPVSAALKVLTPLLDNYTIPITRQGPEYFNSSTQASVASLCIIMVGLPARGKTFLAQKICRLLGWHGCRAKVLNIQVVWRRLLMEYKKCRQSSDTPAGLSSDGLVSSPRCALPETDKSPEKSQGPACCNVVRDTPISVEQTSTADPNALPSPGISSSTVEASRQTDYVCAEHFRSLICDPDSVERRLYRCVLGRCLVDAKAFYANGGEVLVVNDDFPTEELRDEAEALFSPLASQTFFMEVIRSHQMSQKFNELKVKDSSEYPHDVAATEAQQDFARRVEYLSEVYTTLTSTSSSQGGSPEDMMTPIEGSHDNAMGLDKRKCGKQREKRYIKLRNLMDIEVRGVTGYTASRIVSYVMSLTQQKVRHPIFFVRHGESLYNLEDRIGGDSALSPNGEKGANEILGFLASLKEYCAAGANKKAGREGRLDASDGKTCAARSSEDKGRGERRGQLELWTSQLRRAIQTVENGEQLLGIKTVRWSSLNEIHAGVCEELTYAEVRERHPLIDHFRNVNKYTFRYPEGESYQDLVLRLEPVIMQLENADCVVVVVAHRAVLRALLAYFGSTSAESCVRLDVPHRTVWRCTYNSKGIASLDELKFALQ